MNSAKHFTKLFICYFNSINVPRIQIHCSYRFLHIQQNSKINGKFNLFAVQYQRYSNKGGCSDEDKIDTQNINTVNSRLGSFKVFQDHDSPVILDIDEERRIFEENPEYFQIRQEKEKQKQFFGMNLERGETGVFDIEELVAVLKHENALNIVTIAVPSEFRYVDYMVIVSGRSFKHLCTMAEYIRKLFKLKRSESDIIPKIEGFHSYGKDPSNWLALDLENIALHLFLEPVRRKYDLETLWAVGKEFDDLCHAKDNDYISLLKQHSLTNLNDLVPSDDSLTEQKNELA